MAKILWGSISQVQGPVVDVKFSDELPGLRNDTSVSGMLEKDVSSWRYRRIKRKKKKIEEKKI